MAAKKIVNINVGVLGHVDSGKTTLTKAISTQLSTASMDKSKQSQERGITLDLGFSCFLMDMPEHLLDSGYEKIQFTMVDCPGHASLIRTIIGGAQIIDMMLLVIDVNKGIQTQTAECLVIGEILTPHMIVVLNKVDCLKNPKKQLPKIKKKLSKIFGNTKFGANIPMVGVSANPGGKSTLKEDNIDQSNSSVAKPQVDELMDILRASIRIPERDEKGQFYFAIDHCFGVKGVGTVVTGTILAGEVSVNQIIEIASLKLERKIKSIQMFRKPVQNARKGDRVGICMTQLDPKLIERGIACAPKSVGTMKTVIARVEKIRFYKKGVKTKQKFHITIGHSTVMATAQFFGVPQEKIEANLQNLKVREQRRQEEKLTFNFEKEYVYLDELHCVDKEHPKNSQFAILEFPKSVTCPVHSILIGSKLDTDIHTTSCRLAFHGVLLDKINWSDLAEREKVKVFKYKERAGIVDRVVDDYNLIGKDLFSKETDMSQFIGLKVTLDTGEVGRIEGGFGKGDKFKAYFSNGLPKPTEPTPSELAQAGTTQKGKKKKKPKRTIKSKLTLRFKKFVFSQNKKAMVQS